MLMVTKLAFNSNTPLGNANTRYMPCSKKTSSALASPEKIPTNRLAERLKRLELEGLISKSLYQSQPKRYEYLLTQKGIDTLPILQSLVIWGNKYIEDTWVPPKWFMQIK